MDLISIRDTFKSNERLRGRFGISVLFIRVYIKKSRFPLKCFKMSWSSFSLPCSSALPRRMVLRKGKEMPVDPFYARSEQLRLHLRRGNESIIKQYLIENIAGTGRERIDRVTRVPREKVTPRLALQFLWHLFEMTRAIRAPLNCQSRCRLSSQKGRLEKRDKRPRRDKTGSDEDREEGQGIALFGSTMYVVMPKRHAHETLLHNGAGRVRKIALAVREERIRASSVSAWRLQLFPACSFSLSLSLSLLLSHPPSLFTPRSPRHTFSRYCFFSSMNYGSR